MTESFAITDPLDDARRDLEPVMELGIPSPGPRLPAATRLGRVSLQISDMARSLEYYQRVLGLRIIDESDASAMLGTEDGVTPLVHLLERRGARHVPQHGRLGLYHYALLLPDRPALGRFIQHLATIGERAGAADHLVSEAIYLRDPDGLGIEVYADRPRSSWRTADRQLQMATEPLDVEAVVGSANGRRWTGMPEGTRMGHVHLHVRNLELAAEFFHVALGFDKMVWSYPSALFLAAGGYHHHLGLNTWAGVDAPRPTDDDARLLEWRIELPTANDARRAAESLLAAGNEVAAEGSEWRALDPWGTAVRLLAQS